jgi:hypothetical protein
MIENKLTVLFRKLGARDPAKWADSQLNEGIPQLARFVFLREAWRLVIDEHDSSWISVRVSDDPGKPGGCIGPALKRLLDVGASEADLTAVVRVMQWRLLFAFCQLLDDPGNLETDVKDVAWRLFQVDEDELPGEPITGLHESVLETEPSGREMRSSERI